MALAFKTTFSDDEWKGGELLFAGGTDWAMIGRSSNTKKDKKNPQEELERERNYPNLCSPYRFKNLMNVKIKFVVAGAAAVHCMAGDEHGRVYTMGRNEKGQLGLGDLTNRQMPTLVPGLSSKEIVGGACGRFHSVFMTKDGESYTCGLNLSGQCGTGSVKSKGKVEELIKTPVRALVEKATSVAAGVDYSLWLCDGKVWAAGNPQHGQLGDGSDHAYNAKDSSIQIMYEPQATPKMVKGMSAVRAIRIAAGHNHSVAVDEEGEMWTWGCGNYGRLGHKAQKDEMLPRKVEALRGPRTGCGKDPVLAASSNCTFVTTVMGQMYYCGKVKTSGDNAMYPVPEYNLQGWNVRDMSCGASTYGVAADKSVIIWGAATNGELAYGVDGKKSSANPAKCDSLEGMLTHQVCCGVGFSLFLIDPSVNSEEVAKLPVYENTAPDTSSAVEVANPGATAAAAALAKKKGAKAAPPAKGKGKAEKVEEAAAPPAKKAKVDAKQKPKAKPKKKKKSDGSEEDDVTEDDE